MAIAGTTTMATAEEVEAVRPFVWNRSLLRQLLDAGVVREGDRVELMEGELVVMPVQKEPHTVASELTEEALRAAFGATYHVRGQRPVALGDVSEPEPDIAVVLGTIRDYLSGHPTPAAVALLVEVSDTTLRYDRLRKLSVYAKYGIVEVWILNLQERVLEVYREPDPDPLAWYGFGYRSRTVVPAEGRVTPRNAPGATVAVADLLP